jgi:hypothetical protein
VQKTPAAKVSDQAMRVVSINGEYNVGVGVVHRAKTAGRDVGGGIEHSQCEWTEMLLDTGGKDRAGRSAALLGEGPEQQSAANLARRVLNGRQAQPLGLLWNSLTVSGMSKNT